MKRYLVLENGEVFAGLAFGAPCDTVGELVFTTGMCGYLETLTDPSYAGQIVMQTYPLIGNYGIIPEDFEGACCVRGYVVREWCEEPSNFRCQKTLDEFLKEQGIIGQEIRMIEDNPDWQLYTRMMQALYQKSTARTSIAGTVESISHITAETLYDCHKAFYTPSNMILTVVGNVDPVHVADLARRILPREGGPVIPRDYGQEPAQVAAKETRMAMEVSAPQFLTAYKCAPAADGEDYLRTAVLGDMACDILLGDSSPLYQRLYEEGVINTSFGGAFEMMPGVAYLYAGGDSKDARRAAAEIQREAERLAAEGIDEDYYQRVRRASFGSNLRGLNSFENIAVTLTEGYFHGYDPFRFPQVFDSITKEDVAAFLRRNLTAERAVLSEIVPREN